MLERALVVLALAAAVVAIWVLVRLWRAWRLRRLRAARPLADLAPAGRPAVIAFSTPNCADCRHRQAPALARLAARLGDGATIRTLSAPDHPALVRQLGILTAPATVVVDADGRVRHLNLGYAPEARLRDQLARLE
jgi:thiol-disulfide isomerase/thioredoxin